MTFVKRYLLRHSAMDLSPYLVVHVCLILAVKAEEARLTLVDLAHGLSPTARDNADPVCVYFETCLFPIFGLLGGL